MRRRPLVALAAYPERYGSQPQPCYRMPDWRKQPQTCRWCGGALAGRQTDYCGAPCRVSYQHFVYWAGAQGLRRQVFARDGFACTACGLVAAAVNEHGMRIPNATMLECDHIVPVSAGGSDDVRNLRTLCVACHKARHGRAEATAGRTP